MLAFGGELAPFRTYEFTLYTLYRSLLGADYFDDMYEVIAVMIRRIAVMLCTIALMMYMSLLL